MLIVSRSRLSLCDISWRGVVAKYQLTTFDAHTADLLWGLTIIHIWQRVVHQQDESCPLCSAKISTVPILLSTMPFESYELSFCADAAVH
jgi:hypothetical protein